MKTTLQRWGDSQGIRIPQKMVDNLGLKIGSEVLIQWNEDFSALKVSPATDSPPIRGHHKLEDLIARSHPNALSGKEEWCDAQGTEVW